MAGETIFTNWVFKDYVFPLIFVWALLFGVLEKTKLLGDGKKQLNAIISIVVSMIFVAFVFPKQVVSNLVLFMAVSLVVIFVFLILYSFVMGDKDGFKLGDGFLKKLLVWIIFIAVVIAVIWATGSRIEVINLLFRQDWSETFWMNVILIGAIAGVLAIVFKKSSG